MFFICLLFGSSFVNMPCIQSESGLVLSVNTSCGAEMSHGLNNENYIKERKKKGGKKVAERQTTYDYFQKKGVLFFAI